MKNATGMTVLIVGAVMAQASAVQAAGADATAGTTPIKPSSVMGDRDRSGPDGWTQAPISRTRAPAQTAKAAGEPDPQTAKTAPATPKPMNPGDDPGTPGSSPVAGPGKTTSQ